MRILSLALLALGASVSADSSESLLSGRIASKLAIQTEVEAEVQGVQNCINKCQKMFGTTAFSGQVQGQFPGGFDTYEFSACRVGCTVCTEILSTVEPDAGACFKTCKNTNWFNNVDGNGTAFPILKGIIEPDKACEMGCVINTCQYVCTGGTVDALPTAANNGSWWGNGGCSIKTGAIRPGGFYAQNSQYSLWNTPGNPACCAQAYNLCFYQSDATSQNYANVLLMSQQACTGTVTDLTVTGICAYFNDVNKCGSFLGE
jgi:hypothetical protein